MHSPEEYAEAHARDGAPADSRPAEVEEYLANLGTEPVTWDGPSDIWSADAYGPLKDLCEHDAVADKSDVAAAVPGASETDVSRLLRIHGLSITEPETERADRLNLPLTDSIGPENVRTPLWEDARVLEHLYLTCGMGTEEIARALSHVRAELHPDSAPPSTEVAERDVRAALEAVGLVPSADADGGRNEYGVDGRWDTTLMHREAPDLTVSTENIEEWENQPAGADP